MRRRILVPVVGLVVILASCWVYARHRGHLRLIRAVERFEAEIGTLDASAHAPATLADAENSALWLERGVQALDMSRWDRDLADTVRSADCRVVMPQVEELLARNTVALEHLRRAGELRYSSWGLAYDTGQPPEMTDFVELIAAEKLLLAEVCSSLAANDVERGLSAVRALNAVSRNLAREPLLISQIIANHAELFRHAVVQMLVQVGSGEREGFAWALLDEVELPSEEQARDALWSAIAVEASWLVEMIDRTTETDAWWGWLIQAPADVWAPFETAAGIELYHRLARSAELPATQVARYVRAGSDSPPVMRVIAATLIPNLIDVVEKHRALAASRRLARLAIDLRWHGSQHGSYAQTLEARSESRQGDPYADGGLSYELLADGSATVSYPEARALWRSQNPYAAERSYRPLFVWHLPAPLPAPRETGFSS